MTNDLERLQIEYEERERRLKDSDRYLSSNPAHVFITGQLHKRTFDLLREHEINDLTTLSILEVGCGYGGIMEAYLHHGANTANVFGVDLLFNRLRLGRKNHSEFSMVNADGQVLPFPSGQFNLVLQYTAFSSVLDDDIRKKMAREMLRVIHPEGMILWYDFWLNPLNRQTRGIRPAEIRQLFPDCAFDFHKITLAPPLTRRLVPSLSRLARFLEGLSIFNTHYLVVISPKNGKQFAI